MQSKTFKKAALAIALAQCVTGVAVAAEGETYTGETNNTIQNASNVLGNINIVGTQVNGQKGGDVSVTATQGNNTLEGSFKVVSSDGVNGSPVKVVFSANDSNIVNVTSGNLDLESYANVVFNAQNKNEITIKNGNIYLNNNGAFQDKANPVLMYVLATGAEGTNKITGTDIILDKPGMVFLL